MKLPKHPKWCPHIRKCTGKIVHIYAPIFCRNYYAVVGVPAKEFKREFKKQLGLNVEEPDGRGKFFNIELAGMEIGVIWSEDKGSTLMHECLHASMWGLNSVGIVPDKDNDEVLAYHQEFLFKWAAKR